VEAQRQPELVRGLAVRAQTRGPCRGERSVMDYPGAVAAACGVVRQPPVVGRAPRYQLGQRPGVGGRPLSLGK
jgi:hypothetical protein